MSNTNSVSSAQCVTDKEWWSLKTFGFLTVKINDELPEKKCNISVDESGNPDMVFIECSSDQAAELAEHVRKTRWDRCWSAGDFPLNGEGD